MSRYEKMTAEYRLAERWFPKGALKIEHPEDLGVVYVAPFTGDKWQAVAYRGTAGKAAYNYSFKNVGLAENFVTQFFGDLTEHAKRVVNYRRESYKPSEFKVGDVVTNSWGYDQTNVDWYRVVRATEHFVWLQPISAHVEETSFMAGPSTPFVDTSAADPSKWSFVDLKAPVERHKATELSVTFRHGSGSKWDGRAMHCSWYA